MIVEKFRIDARRALLRQPLRGNDLITCGNTDAPAAVSLEEQRGVDILLAAWAEEWKGEGLPSQKRKLRRNPLSGIGCHAGFTAEPPGVLHPERPRGRRKQNFLHRIVPIRNLRRGGFHRDLAAVADQVVYRKLPVQQKMRRGHFPGVIRGRDSKHPVCGKYPTKNFHTPSPKFQSIRFYYARQTIRLQRYTPL